MSSVCTGSVTPSTIVGMTSDAASLPTNATPRAFIHGAIDAWNPAALRPTGHGPSFVAARPAAGAQQHRIAWSDLDAGLLLPRLDIFLIDRRCPAPDTARPSGAGCRAGCRA